MCRTGVISISGEHRIVLMFLLERGVVLTEIDYYKAVTTHSQLILTIRCTRCHKNSKNRDIFKHKHCYTVKRSP